MNSQKLNIPILIFFGLTLLYILFGYGVTISNDSVTNVDQITALDLWSRSSHFSFHIFGIAFYLLFSKLFGLSAVASIELMLALFSASSSVALYLITKTKYGSVSQSILTVIIYSLASGIFRFSCQVEYLVLVPSLVLISLFFYSRKQYLASGVFFGLGLLTSLFAALFIPAFFLFTSFKEIFTKQNLVFALSLVAVYLLINIFTYQETVSGHWSYGGEVNRYKQIIDEINFLRPASIYVYGYLRSFNILILLIPFALFPLYKTNRQLFYIFIITIIFHLPLAIPEARYGGYQMTAYPIFAVASAFLLTNIIRSRKWIITIVLIFSSLNFYIIFSERTFSRDLKETYVSLNSELDSNSVLIVYQAIKPIRNIYAHNLQIRDLLSDYQDKMEKNNPGYTATDLTSLIKNNDTLYVLESGVSMPDDKLKLLVSNFTKDQGAKVKGFALEKMLSIDPNLKVEKLQKYPLDVYKLTKRNE